MVKEDRGPLDLTLLIEEKDKEIAELKKDNKLLADQVYELKKENADLKNKLDNRSGFWYNKVMKNIMIAFLVLCFTASVGNANENNIINKITNHISNEIQETKEFQKKNWAKGNAQLKRNFNTIKSWFVKE